MAGIDQTQIHWVRFGGPVREGRLSVSFHEGVESSPQGDRLVGLIYRRADNWKDPYGLDLAVVDLAGNRLFKRTDARMLQAVALAPDREKIAFQTREGLGYFLISTGGARMAPGTSSNHGAHSLGWSPTSDRIVYEAEERIFIYDLKTRASKFLAPGHNPTWSPDGTRIAYRALDERAMLITPSASDSRVLLNGRTIEGGLRWSPDSKYLLFGDRRGQTILTGILGAISLSPPVNGRLGVLRLSDGRETILDTGISDPQNYFWVSLGPK